MKVLPPYNNFKPLKFPAGDIFQFFGENADLYGKQFHYQDTGQPMAGHNGVDMGKGFGTPLLAGAKAIVADVKFSPDGYGRHLRLLTWDEDEQCFLELTYGHCSVVSVNLGDIVQSGQQIALEGNSGVVFCGGNQYWGEADPKRCGSHCHFQIRKLKVFDPAVHDAYITWLNKQYYVMDYRNGFMGSVDPMNYLDYEQLIKDSVPSGTPPVDVAKITILGKLVKLMTDLINALKRK